MYILIYINISITINQLLVWKKIIVIVVVVVVVVVERTDDSSE